MTTASPPPTALSPVLASLGPLELQLESVEHRLFPRPETLAALGVVDGLELRAIEQDDATYLVVDHRRDPSLTARVELWRPTAAPELHIAGLYALCDALARTSL